MMRVLAAIAAVFVPATANAIPLWQNVQSGMTVAEVRQAQPDARPSSSLDPLGNGATCDLEIPSLSVGSDSFHVCFYMLHGRLVQVTLKALSPSRAVFETTVDLLRGKYGKELAAGQPLCRTIGGDMEECTADWVLTSGANISALFMEIGGTNPLFNIVYQTRMAKDASKL
jgi:hypothetical protein